MFSRIWQKNFAIINFREWLTLGHFKRRNFRELLSLKGIGFPTYFIGFICSTEFKKTSKFVVLILFFHFAIIFINCSIFLKQSICYRWSWFTKSINIADVSSGFAKLIYKEAIPWNNITHSLRKNSVSYI